MRKTSAAGVFDSSFRCWIQAVEMVLNSQPRFTLDRDRCFSYTVLKFVVSIMGRRDVRTVGVGTRCVVSGVRPV